MCLLNLIEFELSFVTCLTQSWWSMKNITSYVRITALAVDQSEKTLSLYYPGSSIVENLHIMPMTIIQSTHRHFYASYVKLNKSYVFCTKVLSCVLKYSFMF